MKLSAGLVSKVALGRVFRIIWPRSTNDVFVLDGKWVIWFHVFIVFLLLAIHFKLAGMDNF